MTIEELIRIYGRSPAPVNPMPRRQFTGHGTVPYARPSLDYRFQNPGLLDRSGVRVTPLPDDAPLSRTAANLRDYRRAIDPATVREGDVAMMRRAPQGSGFGNEIDWGTLREGDVETMRRIVSEWDRKKRKK